MPPIQPIKPIAYAIFISHQLKLPVGWKQPLPFTDEGDQYNTGIDMPWTLSAPTYSIPLFTPCNFSKEHCQAADDRSKDFREFMDSMLDAVVFSHNMWRLQAKFKDLKVNALTALGTPGCLDGPELESNIKNAPMTASMVGNFKKYRDAVAAGVSKCYKEWQDKVTVPGLPWYPAFVAFPGPQAPPMPNIPMPLIVCPSATMPKIVVPSNMKDAMVDALEKGLKDEDKDKQHVALFDGIATALALAFLMWMPQQQIMLVLGKGPIPTFAPPYVPVGPVVMGDNIATPGHLMV